MKNKILSVAVLAALALVIVTNNVNAKSWRINNIAARMANFLDINAACASEEVVDGDTLYLDPGCNLTSNQTVTKQLTIVGTGYCLTEQPYVSASVGSNATLYLSTAGIKVTGLNSKGLIGISADNITIERCKSGTIYIENKVQNLVIRQCYCPGIKGSNTYSYNNIGWIIENNIFADNGGKTQSSMGYVQGVIGGEIRNNIFSCKYSDGNTSKTRALEGITNSLITNNIIVIYTENRHNYLFSNFTDCQVTNNLLSCDEGTYPEYPNNTCLGTHELTSIFTCSGADDRYYEMTENSPARAIQAGAFYGSHPYVFSGFPYGHPYYTSVNVSPRAKDGKIHITLNSKVQDE